MRRSPRICAVPYAGSWSKKAFQDAAKVGEARAVFDVKLYKKKIQPIWVEITNGTDELLVFLPRSVDANYHSPLEVAQKSLNMRSGASTKDSIVTDVERGVVLTNLETKGKWTKVRHSSGTTGWIYSPLLWP